MFYFLITQSFHPPCNSTLNLNPISGVLKESLLVKPCPVGNEQLWDRILHYIGQYEDVQLCMFIIINVSILIPLLLQGLGYAVSRISSITGIRQRNLYSRLAERGIRIRDKYSDISVEEIIEVVHDYLQDRPNLGTASILSRLQERDVYVQRCKIVEAVRIVKDLKNIPKGRKLNRRKYIVRLG